MTVDFLLIGGTALVASLLTFFSGFGLGTMLMPVFAIFFPVEMAVALTAVVHFLNNVFKFSLIGGSTNKEVLLKFGIAAIPAAFGGAWLLVRLAEWHNTLQFNIMSLELSIEPVKAVIGIIMIFFSLFELIPSLSHITFKKDKLWLGGLISGFFGGLSGHQGAMRSAFLINTGLTKEAFIATGIAISMIVDLVRMSIYSSSYISSNILDQIPLLATAAGSAFAGAIAGRLLLKKITYESIRYIVGTFLVLIGLGLVLGII